MAGIKCPFCGVFSSNTFDTYRSETVRFYTPAVPSTEKWRWIIHMLRCPNCGKVSYSAEGAGSEVSERVVMIHPENNAIQFPEYVPMALRADYEEAVSILHKSPKASATLARRCLQGMIHDFWGIRDNTLYAEISALKDRIPPAQWSAIDAVRSIGNIGAHMEKDVNLIIDISADEAEKLINLIELLIAKWYISRHDEEQLYKEIVGINSEKQEQRGK